jgi:hypothetical protein
MPCQRANVDRKAGDLRGWIEATMKGPVLWRRRALLAGLCICCGSCGGGESAPPPAGTQIEPSHRPPIVESDLDQAPELWALYTEYAGRGGEISAATTPSLDGQSLKCAHLGGGSNGKVDCHRYFPPDAAATDFVLSLAFWIPATSYNDQGSPSLVRGLSFWMQSMAGGQARDWELSWQNAGAEAGSPQWRIWNPHDGGWVALGLPARLAGNEWHSFRLVGRVENGQTRYVQFSLDDHVEGLDLSFAPVIVTAPGEFDRLAVGAQLLTNANGDPYGLYVDRVRLEH